MKAAAKEVRKLEVATAKAAEKAVRDASKAAEKALKDAEQLAAKSVMEAEAEAAIAESLAEEAVLALDSAAAGLNEVNEEKHAEAHPQAASPMAEATTRVARVLGHLSAPICSSEEEEEVEEEEEDAEVEVEEFTWKSVDYILNPATGELFDKTVFEETGEGEVVGTYSNGMVTFV